LADVQRYIDELSLLHAIRLCVVATDAEGVVTFANEAGAEAFAATRDELVGRRLLEIVEPADAEEPLAKVLAGETWRGDAHARRLDGATWLASLAATPVRDENGVTVGMVVVADDMTAAREDEALRAAAAERLRLAHRAARLGAWQWRMSDGLVLWDRRLEEIFGLPPGGYDGTFETWAKMLHPEDSPEMLAIVEEAIATLSPYVLRSRIVHPDGSVHAIEAFGEVTKDEHGDASGTIGVVRDVTHEKETARDLERAYAQQRLASARSELLRQLMSELTLAETAAEISAALEPHLVAIEALMGGRARLRVPDDLTLLANGGTAFLRGTRELPASDLILLDDLAAQVSLAAVRAHHQQRTTEIADQLQSSLAASPLPAVPDVQIAASYAPGGDELEHVGGDWYDVIETESGEIALVVGDVMGRGVHAATTMIRVRAGIRGLVTVDPEPGVVMTRADQLVSRDAGDQFVTAVTLLLDPAGHRLRLCNAGHVPAIVADADGFVQVVGGGTGVPLGLLDDVAREVLDIPFGPGATVVLVTDGVIEARDHDVDEGVAALVAQVGASVRKPVDELAADVAALADRSLLDDVTVLVARLA
jgi:PAS domain S-box-containing protein